MADEILTTAFENGINYFDTGDAFCNGQSEIVLGNILKKKDWARNSYIVSSKIFWKNGPSTHLGGGLSRKFIIEAVEASLRRLQLKYIDILIIHKLDAMCPMEEIVIIHLAVRPHTDGDGLLAGTHHVLPDQQRHHLLLGYAWCWLPCHLS